MSDVRTITLPVDDVGIVAATIVHDASIGQGCRECDGPYTKLDPPGSGLNGFPLRRWHYCDAHAPNDAVDSRSADVVRAAVRVLAAIEAESE